MDTYGWDKKKKKTLELKLLLKMVRRKDLYLPVHIVWQPFRILESWDVKMSLKPTWLIWKHPSASQSYIFIFYFWRWRLGQCWRGPEPLSWQQAAQSNQMSWLSWWFDRSRHPLLKTDRVRVSNWHSGLSLWWQKEYWTLMLSTLQVTVVRTVFSIQTQSEEHVEPWLQGLRPHMPPPYPHPLQETWRVWPESPSLQELWNCPSEHFPVLGVFKHSAGGSARPPPQRPWLEAVLSLGWLLMVCLFLIAPSPSSLPVPFITHLPRAVLIREVACLWVSSISH